VGLLGRKFVGWDNYLALVHSPELRQVLGNTVRYLIFIVPASVVIPLGLAILIMELPSRISSIFRVLFYLPVAIGGIALIATWLWIFNPDYGILNYVLSLVGVPPVAWLGSTRTSLFSISLVYLLSVACSYFTLIYGVAIGGIPRQIIEAAKLDGAGPFQIIRFVVVPLLRPTISYVSLSATITSISLWVYPKIFTRGGPIRSSSSFGYWVYETAFVHRKLGLASAQAILLLLFVLGFCLVLGRVTYEV